MLVLSLDAVWFFRASSNGQRGKRAVKTECKGEAGESVTMIVLSLNMDVALGLNEGVRQNCRSRFPLCVCFTP